MLHVHVCDGKLQSRKMDGRSVALHLSAVRSPNFTVQQRHGAV